MDSNQNAIELYKSLYELTIMMSMILGFHPRSKNLYNSELNRSMTSEGFLICFIDTDPSFPFQFKTLFSSMEMIDNPKENDLMIALNAINFFLDLC